jgi:catechol 2,3-dioxygenase-like lactoylglutathione lyase family enzyme
MIEPFKRTHISRRRLLLSLPALAMAPRAFAQSTNPPIRVRGINHVTIAVSDVKRSKDFYQGLFGMPNVNPGTEGADLQIGSGPQCLDLAAAGSNAPNINHICLAVDNFDVNRLKNILAQHGFTESEAAEPMRMYVRAVKNRAPQLFFRDPDGIRIQLQDPRYTCGMGPLGNTCPKPETSPKKGLIALRDWSHCTNAVSDPARSQKFYQDLFGFRIQAYQGPSSPMFNIGKDRQFLAFGGGGAGARGGTGAAARAGSISHSCMTMDNFDPEKVIKTLENYGIKPRGNAQGAPGPLVHYISMRMENRGGAKEGTPELYFTDPDGLIVQLQDTKYCGGGGVLGDVCTA